MTTKLKNWGGTIVYVAAKVTEEKCIGCKLCVLTCPDPNVIRVLMPDKKVQVDENRCKGCGLCAEICSKGALAIVGN